MSVCWFWEAFCSGSLFYSRHCNFNSKWGIYVVFGCAEHILSLSTYFCTHTSITRITRYVYLFPRTYQTRPTLQPFISPFYLQNPSIKATGKTALTSDLNLQVWPFQELNVFLNVHCFSVIPCANVPQS